MVTESAAPDAAGLTGQEEAARRTALDVFANRVAATPDEVALRRKEGGTWKSCSWREWDLISREVAGGLASLGFEVGDRAVILSQTRAEWVEVHVGVLMAGGVSVPIYPSNTPSQTEYVITNSGAKIAFVEDPHQLEKLFDPEVRSKLEQVERVVYLSDVADLERPDAKGRKNPKLDEVLPQAEKGWVMSFEELREAGSKWLEENQGRLDEIARDLDPSQPFSIIYTSGTTGNPKGVVITHSNIAFECNAVKDLLELGAGDEQLLFLPLAHVFAKVLLWASVQVGASIAFAESIPKLVQNLQEVKPTFMGAVPRVYEKAYAKIQASFEEKRKKPVTRALINWALKKGGERSKAEQGGQPSDGLSIKLADKLVFSKVRDTFGGRIKFFVSGGAPLAREIAEFFHAAGVLVLEGYGLTETTAAHSVNRPDDFAFGTVGPPIPGVETKIADDGEILMRGGHIMKGYYNNPEATAEVLDEDGWFHSGDIGEIDSRGHIRITDRKKDIIVTGGGKNVAPQNIENAFKTRCPLASQIVVIGDKRPYLVALVTLNEEAMVEWARDKGMSYENLAELSKKPEVEAVIRQHVDELNATLPSYETIKRFTILDRDFDQESGELTPTLKVKRKAVSEKFAARIEQLYA
jgi:long-chain acyl-CoA synthetase